MKQMCYIYSQMNLIRQCLIIAAGMGSRLASTGVPKPLVHINGMPLIHHVVLSVAKGGIEDFTFVLGYEADKIATSIKEFCRRQELGYRLIFNEEWRRANGLSVLRAKEGMHDPFLLTMCDHLYPPSLVELMLVHGLDQDVLRLAIDRRIDHNPLVDMEDVTRVKTKGDRIQAIGKHLESFDAFDTGVFMATPLLFDALQSSISAGDDTLSGGVRVLAAADLAGGIDIGDLPWLDVDDEAALAKTDLIFHARQA